MKSIKLDRFEQPRADPILGIHHALFTAEGNAENRTREAIEENSRHKLICGGDNGVKVELRKAFKAIM